MGLICGEWRINVVTLRARHQFLLISVMYTTLARERWIQKKTLALSASTVEPDSEEEIALPLRCRASVKRSDVARNPFEWLPGENNIYVLYDPHLPHFIVIASSRKTLDVKVIEFHRIAKKQYRLTFVSADSQ